MKLISQMIVMLGLVASTSSWASGLTCAAENVYYSSQRIDSDVPPQTGAVTGTTVILLNREILLSYDDIEGLRPHGAPPVQLRLEGEPKVLVEEGNESSGSKTFKQMSVLVRVDPLTFEVTEELLKSEVTCTQSWKQVP